ncbi:MULTISPECIES: hypothetical protein [unclassified Streptomyces]|uniref:hypothetical protein n=1 Tax=unclassified Streptomyces TaxID=2593676 RepID=UPI003D8C2310
MSDLAEPSPQGAGEVVGSDEGGVGRGNVPNQRYQVTGIALIFRNSIPSALIGSHRPMAMVSRLRTSDQLH